jgi:hypothetical protein
LLFGLSACTGQALKQTGYETLHNISDLKNDRDPNYDPSQRPSYEVYQQQRQELLHPPQTVPVNPAAESVGTPADK